ncbi:copper resistance protein B [Microbulbifer sp. SAOS-129_SWC]|uniref:copper resistance protein B n=1 Tax=Microbulbifer sp. SAOS-129_SWC TaxID=3145235 RepID=UPI0032167742
MRAIILLTAALAAATACATNSALAQQAGPHSGHGNTSAAYPAAADIHQEQKHAPNLADHVMDHDHPLAMVRLDQLEARENDGGALEGDAWYGNDRDKLWLKADWERGDGDTEKAELQALYSRAIAPYWDLQMGVRHDFEAESSSRNWATIGLNGLAPYFFEINPALFVGDNGDSALRLQAEYELLFTQRWILSPEFEADVFGQNDREAGTGAGLTNVEVGLRLRYEITPQFAPYFGVHYEKKFGNAADFARDDGESVSGTSWVIGLRTWF